MGCENYVCVCDACESLCVCVGKFRADRICISGVEATSATVAFPSDQAGVRLTFSQTDNKCLFGSNLSLNNKGPSKTQCDTLHKLEFSL